MAIAIAVPNGASKTTFYDAFLRHGGLRLLNADEILNGGAPAGRSATPSIIVYRTGEAFHRGLIGVKARVI